jgi:peptide/nickel transport system substrate-binding protein
MWPRRRRRRGWVVAAALLAPILGLAAALAALLLAVGPVSTSDTYVEAVVGEPPLLNPVLAPYTLAGQDLLPLVFSGLVRADPDGNVAPDLADGWEISPDRRAYTFRLRQGLVWHDGAPLTADDVAFTVRMVQAPDHQGSQELADLWRGVAVEAPDPRTVRFTLPEPLASFPEHLTLGLLPRHLLEGVAAGELPFHPFNHRPVGSGPFQVVETDPERIALERWGGNRAAVATPRESTPLRRIELRLFADRSAALDALVTGRVDGLNPLRPDEVERVGGSSRVVVYTMPERSKVATLSLNVRADPFRERAVRLAAGRAIDRDELIRRALGGRGEPAFGPIPVQSWAYARAPGADFDPAAAARTLDEAGWTAGPTGVREREGTPLAFSLLAADTPEWQAVARELAAQLGRIGMDVQIRPLPADELTEEHLEPRQFQAALVGRWAMGSDPDVYPLWHSSQATRFGGNYAGFSDPDVDRWLEVGRQDVGREGRRNAYLHFQARWAEEQPSVVLYHPLHSFAVSRDVWGIVADPLPDSSWRLRDAAAWHRPIRPTLLQRARAAVAERLPTELAPVRFGPR